MEKLNSGNFNKVKECDFCVVDFSANWCGPCRMLKPIIEDIESMLGDVTFYNVDVDECEDIAKEYKIFSIPTILAFKKGVVADTMVGLGTQDEIIDFIYKNR